MITPDKSEHLYEQDRKNRYVGRLAEMIFVASAANSPIHTSGLPPQTRIDASFDLATRFYDELRKRGIREP